MCSWKWKKLLMFCCHASERSSSISASSSIFTLHIWRWRPSAILSRKFRVYRLKIHLQSRKLMRRWLLYLTMQKVYFIILVQRKCLIHTRVLFKREYQISEIMFLRQGRGEPMNGAPSVSDVSGAWGLPKASLFGEYLRFLICSAIQKWR